MPHSGAPKARGLTATSPTERSRCASYSDTVREIKYQVLHIIKQIRAFLLSVALPCGKACASCALSYQPFSPRPPMGCCHACCASSKIWLGTGADYGIVPEVRAPIGTRALTAPHYFTPPLLRMPAYPGRRFTYRRAKSCSDNHATRRTHTEMMARHSRYLGAALDERGQD